MNIKIFKGFQSKYNKLIAYKILKLLLLWGNKTVLFSSPFRTSFAQHEDLFLQSFIICLESRITFCHVGRMETDMICVNFWLHKFGLSAGLSNQEPIHITISFQYSSNKLFNCYNERCLIMMWHLSTAIISNCMVRPLPFTLSFYQCPTWWWLSGQLKPVAVLNRPHIHLHSVHGIIKTNIWYSVSILWQLVLTFLKPQFPVQGVQRFWSKMVEA